MRLTKDMFDFGKYEFFLSKISAGDEYLNMVTATWLRAGQFDHDLRITRVPRPPPRYILLNEGEKLQEGDQQYSPLVKSWCPGISNYLPQKVEPWEIWRRKVQE